MPFDFTTENPLVRDLRILERARDGIAREWGQGRYRTSNCAVDWVSVASSRDSDLTLHVLARWVCPALPLWWKFWLWRPYHQEVTWKVAHFNDARFRKQTQMVRLFEAAIRRVETTLSRGG